MSKIKVNEIEPRSGTTVTVGTTGNNVRSGGNNLQASDGGNLISQCGTTITLGASGDTINLASGASQSGFGRTGTVDWCTTAKTSPLTAVSGKGYFLNTCGGAITVTLPGSPSAGDIVAFRDYKGTWGTACKNVTLNNNSSKIFGSCSTGSLSTANLSTTLVYVDGTQGWMSVNDSTQNITGEQYIAASGGNTTITCGDYKIHVFTADGPLSVTAGAGPIGVAEYLVVGGGGSGGTAGYGGAGGGAGGFRMVSTSVPTSSPLKGPAGIPLSSSGSPYTITVGAGGVGYPGPSPEPEQGLNGANSILSSITAAGGGGGGGNESGGGESNGKPGGSGGASGRTSGTIGSGNTPPVSPPQGQDGGQGDGGPTRSGGGGGGAGAAGGNGTEGPPGVGGPGGTGSYIGDPYIGPTAPSYGTPGPVSSTRYFAGGGGGSNERPGTAGSGGAGGGGAGFQNASGAGTAGTANTGGGGGGSGSPYAGATGGSGIVIVRYKFQ
jgi:hypothetical protein